MRANKPTLTDLVCPKCGGILECHKNISINFVDLIGSSIVLVFFIGFILLVASRLDVPDITLAIAVVIILVIIVIIGWHGQLAKDPIIHSGIFSVAWIEAGVLLLLSSLLRYFTGISIKQECACKSCNFTLGDES